MARFVLLHSPLLGPSSWSGVALELRALGHAAETPAWPRLSSVGEGFYEALPAAVASEVGKGEAPVFVAHSGAGALLPALASRLGAAAAGMVFVDALLPHPGRSWFETTPPLLRDELRSGIQSGLLPAWHEWWPPGALERLVPEAALRDALIAELEPIPAAYFEARAPDDELEAPAAYLRLSGAYDTEAAQAERQGWPVTRLALNHLAILTAPAAVAAAIAALAVKLAASRSEIPRGI